MKPVIDCTRMLWLAAALSFGPPVLADGSGGDAARGQRLFLQCAACHSLQAAPGALGPPLAGIVARKAATTPGYAYSPALGASGLEWNEATLNRWLEHPNALVPGTKMIFAGMANPTDRLAIIAYLKTTAGVDAQ